jgi:hypothetical protein
MIAHGVLFGSVVLISGSVRMTVQQAVRRFARIARTSKQVQGAQ